MNLIRRSLPVKLTLAFLLVSILGTVLVALLVNWQTRRQFDNFVNELYQEQLADLQAELSAYYQTEQSWVGAQSVLSSTTEPFDKEPAAPPPDADFDSGALSPEPDFRRRRLPVMLIDSAGRVVAGGRQYQAGEQAPAEVAESGLPIEVDGDIVGRLVLESFGGDGDFTNTPEAGFLTNVNRSTLWSALLAGAVALLTAVGLARTIAHPVSELTEATARVAQGELGARVTVRSKDEIGQLAASFNQMSTDLARANQLRRQMTADIAHDLRTPLSVIQGYTEALDDGKLQGDSEIYGAMHKQVRHLNRLVEDLRTLSLADAGQLSLHPFAVAPRDLLEHSVLVFTPQAETQQVALKLEIPQALPRIIVDPDRIVQVLGNLVSNALRHTPAGGEIRLSARVDDGELCMQVADTGSGIDPQDLPHLFDRFYRGDKSRSNSGDSGLGLAIARSIVAAHDGRIAVDSTPGAGSTFTIQLPIGGKS